MAGSEGHVAEPDGKSTISGGIKLLVDLVAFLGKRI